MSCTAINSISLWCIFQFLFKAFYYLLELLQNFGLLIYSIRINSKYSKSILQEMKSLYKGSLWAVIYDDKHWLMIIDTLRFQFECKIKVFT